MEICIIPKFILRRISNNVIIQLQWSILISSCIVLISFCIVKMEFVNSIPHFCVFKEITTFPCPGCGIIRSIYYLYDLKFIKSLSFNPCGVLIVLSQIIQVPLRIIVLSNQSYQTSIDRISILMTRLVLLTLLIFWCKILLT